jgi:hypothetical protein
MDGLGLLQEARHQQGHGCGSSESGVGEAMGTELKWIDPNSPAVMKLLQDVPRNYVAYYPVSTFPSGIISDKYLAKSFQIVVAVSGSQTEAAAWMGIFPYRVDYGQSGFGSKVQDLDPAVFLFDSGTATCSGLIAYHQTFDGRTLPIPGHELRDLPTTVAELRRLTTSGVSPLGAAPIEVVSGLHHMAGLLRGFRENT